MELHVTKERGNQSFKLDFMDPYEGADVRRSPCHHPRMHVPCPLELPGKAVEFGTGRTIWSSSLSILCVTTVLLHSHAGLNGKGPS